MIRLPEIKTAELSTYGNFAKCHQAHFRVSRVGLGTRLVVIGHTYTYICACTNFLNGSRTSNHCCTGQVNSNQVILTTNFNLGFKLLKRCYGWGELAFYQLSNKGFRVDF